MVRRPAGLAGRTQPASSSASSHSHSRNGDSSPTSASHSLARELAHACRARAPPRRGECNGSRGAPRGIVPPVSMSRAAPPSTGLSRAAPWLVFGAALALSAWRAPALLGEPRFWAEEATDFYAAAHWQPCGRACSSFRPKSATCCSRRAPPPPSPRSCCRSSGAPSSRPGRLPRSSPPRSRSCASGARSSGIARCGARRPAPRSCWRRPRSARCGSTRPTPRCTAGWSRSVCSAKTCAGQAAGASRSTRAAAPVRALGRLLGAAGVRLRVEGLARALTGLPGPARRERRRGDAAGTPVRRSGARRRSAPRASSSSTGCARRLRCSISSS